MFDVDRLNEALDYDELVELQRMVVAGQHLWWCEEHRASAKGLDEDVFCDRWAEIHDEWGTEPALPCRMVEQWRMPTGTDE